MNNTTILIHIIPTTEESPTGIGPVIPDDLLSAFGDAVRAGPDGATEAMDLFRAFPYWVHRAVHYEVHRKQEPTDRELDISERAYYHIEVDEHLAGWKTGDWLMAASDDWYTNYQHTAGITWPAVCRWYRTPDEPVAPWRSRSVCVDIRSDVRHMEDMATAGIIYYEVSKRLGIDSIAYAQKRREENIPAQDYILTVLGNVAQVNDWWSMEYGFVGPKLHQLVQDHIDSTRDYYGRLYYEYSARKGWSTSS